MQSEVDIAIVGAGAAGLAAGRLLRGAPVSTLVLEARDRLGGRGHTLVAGGSAFDLGCGWLHSADINLFSGLAAELGFPLDKTPPPWTRRFDQPGFGLREQAEYRAALQRLDERIEAARAEPDGAVADLLEPDSRWNPLLNAFSSYYNGVEFDRVSVHDFGAFVDTELNWRTPRGYGTLIAAMGERLPIVLSTPVARIDHGGARLRLETPNGTVTARAVIVTVPSAFLADGRLAFTPDLPAIRAAAEGLPLGLANKVVLATAEPEAFEAESRLYGDPARTATASYHLRPFGRPAIEAYLGGNHARLLEAEGPGAATAFCIEELASVLGSGVRSRLTPLVETRWAADPWARGAYSHALPGRAGGRQMLAQPVDGRIFFAGEAVSIQAFSTAHGAAETGRAAAAAALAALTA